jgi:hypothetical protein
MRYAIAGMIAAILALSAAPVRADDDLMKRAWCLRQGQSADARKCCATPTVACHVRIAPRAFAYVTKSEGALSFS